MARDEVMQVGDELYNIITLVNNWKSELFRLFEHQPRPADIVKTKITQKHRGKFKRLKKADALPSCRLLLITITNNNKLSL